MSQLRHLLLWWEETELAWVTEDRVLAQNRFFHDRLLELDIAHEYIELPGVGHNTMEVFNAPGRANFEFYNRFLSGGQD